MKRSCFAFAAVALITCFTGRATESKLLTIDLPSALRLAGARNIDIQLAREKFAEAHAAEESADDVF